MDLERELALRRREVEDALHQRIPEAGPHTGPLGQAMRHALFSGGKRLRPILLLACLEVCGGGRRDGMDAACAVEMLHTFTLIQDDLPCMDDDDTRRGYPSCHRAYGESTALLAGDALVFRAFSLLSAPPDRTPGPADLRIVGILSDALGMEGVTGGQFADLAAAGTSGDPDLLLYIHEHKTARLLEAAGRCGAILAEAAPPEQDAIAGYCRHLGLAFQITDDLLDVEGDPGSLGKPVGSDQRGGKLTFPRLLGREASRERAGRETERARDALAVFPEEAAVFLRSLAGALLHRTR